MGLLLISLSGCLCLYFIAILIKLLKKVWWTPIRLESMMRLQGIKGPPYRLIHGNTKEITEMRKRIMKSPMELSHHTFSTVQPHIYSWIKLYGKNFLYWYGTRAQLVVTEPNLVKEVLNSKEERFRKVEFQEFILKLLGDGLVFSTGEKWTKMRKLANHAFHAENLRDMVPEMIKGVEVMLERWRHHDGKEIDVFQEFKFLTSEIISRTAFGSNYQEGEKIFDMLMRMISIVGSNHFKVGIPGIKNFFKTRDKIESMELLQGIRSTIINMVNKRQNEALACGTHCYGNDFFGLLVKAYNDQDPAKKISIDDVIDECKTFYVAGQETAASSLTWTVLLLAIHTDWQDMARKEVLELFCQENPTADGIARLKIMSMVINESLRLYSPVLNMTRRAEREVRLGRLIVPAKTEVYIPMLAVHHDPDIWGEDVHLFKPERFAEGVAKATNNKITAFLPFGLGPRSCVGLNFAITEEKVALSMILQRYRFTLSPTYVHSPAQILTISPQHGLQILLEPL